MKRNELLKALKRLKVETGSLVCLGCGHEHNCSIHGCAIIEEAIKAIKTPDKGEKKRGYWENFYGDYSVAECSMCGEKFDAEHSVCKEVRNICEAAYDDIQPMEWWHIFLGKYRYCPNCGAEM